METERHFLFEWPKYENLRQEVLTTAKDFSLGKRKESIAQFFKKGSSKRNENFWEIRTNDF